MSILRVNDIQRATTGSAAIVFDDPVTITTGSISASVLIGSLPGAVTIGDGTIGKEKLTNDARDWVNILNKPSGLLSSSAQLPAAISGTFITPAGVTSSATIFTSGIFSGSGAGLSNIPNSALVNSSITINGTATALGSSRTLVTADISESTNLYYTDARVKAKLNTDGVVSSSGQINYQSVTGQPSVNTLGGDGNKSFTVSAGIFVTASGGADGIIVTNDTANYTLKFRTVGGTVSSSAQVQAALPSGIVSSSTQVVPLLPAGTVSSSTQTKANLPDGTVSASAQYPGWVTASSQIDVRNTTGIATIATTGSNTFIGNQTVSGSVTVTGNLTVQGTSSVLYTTSSQLNVGTNKIIIGTNQTLRFGGLSVIDSASVNQSGSLYWDSVNNTWIYENISGSGYNSAILIGGPKNTGALGNETGLTAGRIPVAVGNDHIDTNNSSGSIRVDFTSLRTDIENSLYVTGSITASAGVSGVSYTTLSNIPSGIISSSTQVAASVPAGTVSSSGQINAGATANFATAVAAQLATVHSASYLGTATTNNLSEGVTNLYYTDARVKTKMSTDVVHSGSYLGTATTTNLTEGSNLYFTDARAVAALPNNTVSSSLQVIASLPAGTVSSSGQINLAQAYNTASQALTASYALVTVGTTAVNTDTLPEGSTNLYYTDARVKTKLNAENVHSSSYLGTATTTNLTEGINLYFTNARVVNALPAGTVSSSAQVQVDLPGGIVSSSGQYPGWVTSSTQVVWSSVNYSAGIVSSSGQVQPLLPASTVSSSTQVTAFLPNGTISSSAQYPGWVTASSQIDYTLTQNTPVLLTGSTLYTNTLTSGVNPTRGIILGVDAGYQASESQNAIYIGEAAGYQAYDASYGIFIGAYAGYRAAEGGGIYIGSSAGADAYSANSVIFMGEQAGQQASSASFSILLGNHVGYNAANTTGIGTNNIIIGNNITLPDDTSNAINLGGIIFATGAHSNIAGNPYSGSQANGKVGIGVINPVNTLQIQGTVSASSYTSSISNAIGFVGTASFATTASSVTPSGLPAGTVSSSAQYPGWVTASSQIDYNSITNKLSGVISSSAQFNALTGTSASYAATSSNLNGGTVNYIPLWNSPTLQASSIIYQTGGQLGINNTVPSGALHVSGTFVVQQILEKVNITASAPPATFNVDVTSGSIFFRSGSTTANWTTNFRGDAGTTLNSMMYNGQSLTLAVIVNQGASTVYSSSTYQIDGASVTPKWQDGLTPTSSVNAQDIYTYTIIKIASASYNLFASQTKFA